MVRKARNLHPLPIFDQSALPSLLHKHNLKDIHSQTIWRYISQNCTASFDSIPNLPSHLPKLLQNHFTTCTLVLSQKNVSIDGTIKLLFRTQDGHGVESVIMKHKGRNTLCVSSQVGCQMGCTFCATGTMGIVADLCSGEILEQLFYANTFAPIRNVVFMGMGEPLQNYDAVIAAIKAMTNVFMLAPKHITLSTVGVIHRIRQLTQDVPSVRLALSLHAPTQKLRSQIVPSSKAFPLHKLMQSVDEFLAFRDNRCVLIEYCMLEGVNDSLETAHLLGQLLQNRSVHVNLIPYNTTDVDAEYRSPSDRVIRNFHYVLRQHYNLKATVRANHGMDIEGACGQLALRTSQNTTKDIEDLARKANKDSIPIQTKSRGKEPHIIDQLLFQYYQPLSLFLICASAICLSIGFLRKK